MASLYDLHLFTNPPLPTPLPSPSRPMSDPRNSSYPQGQPKLSLFQQTLRDEEEAFYRTFPAARIAAFVQDPQSQVWRPSHETSDHLGLGGCGFLLERANALHYPYDPQGHLLPQMPSPSSLSCAVDCASLVCQQSEQVPENRRVSYTALQTAHTTNVHHKSFLVAAPLASSIAPSPFDNHQFNHPLSPPVMNSLPSPAASSDSSATFHGSPQYYTPPHHANQPTPPFNPIPSPTHRELSAPLSPPALVPAVYTHDINAVRPKSDHQPIFADHRPPNPGHSIAPSRRNGRVRSHRRAAQPYARTQNPSHRPGATPNMVWSNAATAPGKATIAPAPVPLSTSPPTNHSGKRNPDKKPALACVFCRGRKIACGPPGKDGDGQTCNQCQRRSLRCEYPTESRRGMRKKPSPSTSDSPSAPTTGTSKAGDDTFDTFTTTNTKPESTRGASKAASNKKR